MNTLVLLPDGVGVRNFVLGQFLRIAGERGPVHALHVIPDDLLDEYARGLNGSVQWHRLAPHRDQAIPLFLRHCLLYAQCYWIDNYPMRLKRQIPAGCSIPRRAILGSAKGVARAAASPTGIRVLDRLHTLVAKRAPEVAHYRKLIEQIKPTVLFCSHQRPNEIVAPVLAAKLMGIPTATFIFSWDNLSSKGRIAAPFDHYFVWSASMRDEMLRYYPDVTEDRIHIVGTPQFDPYSDADLLWSKEEFMARIGADPQRPLICYSGGECGNAVEDQNHVRALMELVREKKIYGHPQVLLRPCPIDDFSRYDAVRRDFPELIYCRPEWRNSSMKQWAASLPSASDVRMLANLTQHADVNVNFASTMTLDFAIRDKPVVNLVFDVKCPPTFGMPMFDYIQQFEHYRPVLELGAARYARSRQELADHVNAYLQDPALDRDGRRRFVELQIGAPIGESSRNIVDALERVSL